MPTTGSKGKPVLAGTDAFAPYTHINNAVNWSETFASVRNVADSTAMNALTGTDLWTGLTVFHTSGTYAFSYWVYNGTAWKMLSLGEGTPRFEATFSTGTWSAVASSTYQAMGTAASTPWTSTSSRGGMSYSSATGLVTVPVAGRYNIYAMASWTPNATGGRIITFAVNGTTVQRAMNFQASGTIDLNMTLSITGWQLSAGNTVGFQNWQSSGGTLAISNTYTPTKIIIEYVGP